MNNDKWTPDQPIRGLSFKQPFASLMLNGKTILILLHELTHWFIDVFLNNSEKYHNKIDKK
ncbi:hypothetical protein SDC9_36987 [bioreactor metagenome]|uniref:Uncharacterized protein n=1 Tax=bioreactor metagenome TaxID=1076179 RepID=A0A644VHR4_9ZZZZ